MVPIFKIEISRSPLPYTDNHLTTNAQLSTMSTLTWRSEYLDALKERSKIEQKDRHLIDAYTCLADRFSSLSATADNSPPITSTSTPIPPSSSPNPSSSNNPQLRADLAEALRAKGHFETRIRAAETELEKLRSKAKKDARKIEELTGERNELLVRVRDRDEELKGKGKLIEHVQDEMVSLNLQLNMSEQKKKQLTKENKELVDRWMARMEKEADAMNDASSFS